MSKRKQTRLYWRDGRGWYADLRSFADVGGKREAMKPEGSRGATDDEDMANRIYLDRKDELMELRENGGEPPEAVRELTLDSYRLRFLDSKALTRRIRTVERYDTALRKFVVEWGEDMPLFAITPEMCEEYMTRRLRVAAVQTVLHEMHALSGLFVMAVKRRRLDFNPVSVLDLPIVEREEAEFLESGEAARLIEAAQRLDANPHSRACPFVGPIIATGLLSGGRFGAVASLEVRDIDFDRGLIRYRPNGWYRLKGKRRAAERTVQLWPDLRDILAKYVERYNRRDELSTNTRRTTRYEGTSEPRRTLLFPSEDGGMLRDLRGSIEKAVQAAGIEKRVTFHTLRHTYGATRMQTLDNGAPVSPFTVMKELGHSSLKMIEEVYGHLQDQRHRSDVVEYREADILSIKVAG